jgi:probable F420-dependent oxidoreductase
MVAVAGEVADGLVCHPLVSRRYLTEALLPHLHAGASAAGRDPDDLEVAAMAMVATGRDEDEMAAAVAATRVQLAFYASTPAYRPVLDMHGWGDLQPELRARSKAGDWQAMGDAIDDEVLGTLAVVAEPASVPDALRDRFGGLADRVGISSMAGGTREALAEVLRSL